MSHQTRILLAFGFAAAVVFIGSSVVLGALLPGYNPISQTISELGESGSPFEIIFRIVILLEATCLILFALGLFLYSSKAELSLLPGALIGFYGLMELGIGVYPSPHPWHNLFGIGSTPGFFAPLGLALAWRGASDLRLMRSLSAAMFAVILSAMVLNLSPIVHPYAIVLEYYGVLQRLLLFTFYFWIAVLAAWLLQRRAEVQTGK